MAARERQVQPHRSEIASLLDWVEASCREHGVADEIRFSIALALEEAVANVVNHANTGAAPLHPITVRLSITGDVVAAEIIDDGAPFDPTTAPDPDLSLPIEQRHPGGLGIHLMRKLTDRLLYRRSEGRNILRIEKVRR
jgi:anti-sigma regulatory factor (Ser/Thr protein kinase)